MQWADSNPNTADLKCYEFSVFSFVFLSQIREEKEFDNLAKMYVADLIKRECWDCMVVKGRGLNAFHNDLEVSNYPLRERPRADLERLERVKEFRRVEMEELKVRYTRVHPIKHTYKNSTCHAGLHVTLPQLYNVHVA